MNSKHIICGSEELVSQVWSSFLPIYQFVRSSSLIATFIVEHQLHTIDFHLGDTCDLGPVCTRILTASFARSIQDTLESSTLSIRTQWILASSPVPSTKGPTLYWKIGNPWGKVKKRQNKVSSRMAMHVYGNSLLRQVESGNFSISITHLLLATIPSHVF